MAISPLRGPIAPIHTLRLSGPLITIGTLIAIEVLTLTVFRVPTPGAVMLLPVAYAAFTGGLWSGLISAAIMVLYTLHLFAVPDQFLQYTSSNAQTIVVLAVVATSMALMTGSLKRRTEQLLRRNQLILQAAGEGICGVDMQGMIVFLNPAAASMCGWTVAELIGQPMHILLPSVGPSDQAGGRRDLEQASQHLAEGLFWRKDGSSFAAEYIRSPIKEPHTTLSEVITFKDISERKTAEEAIQQLNADLERRVAERTSQLQALNKELEAFSYSVSHDLRAPLRSIDGFSLALMEDYGSQLDAAGQSYLTRVRAATQRMAQLIDDLLNLARLSRSDLHREALDLSQLAHTVATELQRAQPEREVSLKIAVGLQVNGDGRLLQIALENLIGNAWKFTAGCASAEIEFGATRRDSELVYFVRDNGAGFDMAYVNKLFGAFQRLHSVSEFTGTGIGLATVQRIIHRHGGRVWAEGAVNSGATFYFTL